MKNYIITLIIILIVAAGGIYFLNAKSEQKITSDKLQVSASFYPLYFFASQIGGTRAEVFNVTPAGSEPHDYDPSTQDIARIESGRMLVLNGAVEAWGQKIQDNLKGTNVTVVTAGQGLLTKNLTEDGKTNNDPHVWLSPPLAKQEVAKITAGYVHIDPSHASYYEQNQRTLDMKLDQLDAQYKAGLANCQLKDIITSHAAFAYMGQAYGLRQIAIAGLSPDEEPSAQQLATVSQFAKDNNVHYIFFESLISPKLSETIANEVHAKTLVLDPIEGISDDGLKQGKNYFTVMEDNLHNLKQALQCTN